MMNTEKSKNNLHVLIDAKKEYTNQLKQTLTEYGKSFTNSMRKKELRELVISL